ncbi:hypothetical protein ACJJTC_011583 [Scirpophaga incertulas]
MEGPGMSLFQGAPSIHINNSAQDRLEEQEELEDRQRRAEELKNELATAFDDLIDDDEASSVNSSTNFTLNAGETNGGGQTHTRVGMPPTYIESQHHLKGQEALKAYCDTPKSIPHLMLQEEPMKLNFSPYGAGDGQNHYYQQDCRDGGINGNDYAARHEHIKTNEELKVLYEIRVKECMQLAGQIENMEIDLNSLRARLTAAVNDKDKAELSLQEAQYLLATSKHKFMDFEHQVTTLKEKLIESEQDKEQLKLELRSTNINLQDVQQRLQNLQVAHTHDTDALFREQQDRHRTEVEMLQNDLVKVKIRLEEKENEIRMLEKRCIDREKEKEQIMVEKRLVTADASKMEEKMAKLTNERSMWKEQVKDLGSKLKATAENLVQCHSKLADTQKEYDNWKTTLHQILMESVPDKTYLGELSSSGKLSTLKDMLDRYKTQMQKLTTLQEELSKRDKKLDLHRKQESELRAKIEEQKGIEIQLNSKLAVLQNKVDVLSHTSDSELLESYRQQNEKLHTELEELRTEHKKLDLKYMELEMESEKLKSEKGSRASIAQEANADLLRELESCGTRLKDALTENCKLKSLYLEACSTRDATSREMKDIQLKIQKEKELFKIQEKEYMERIESEKQLVDKLTTELSSTKTDLNVANKRISELQKDFTDKQKEFNDKLNKYLEDEKNALRKDIEACSQCEKHVKRIRHLDEQLSQCSLKLATQGSNEELMQELKGKAEFFQQYIMNRYHKLHELRSVGTNTDHEIQSEQLATSIEELVQDCDDALAAKTALIINEKAIRDQIAEKFTLEMKTMEMNCARRIKEIENEHLGAITKLKDLLERKAQEVESLKEFILSERLKVTQILEAKENRNIRSYKRAQ